jgi:hypothetical protein
MYIDPLLIDEDLHLSIVLIFHVLFYLCLSLLLFIFSYKCFSPVFVLSVI